VCDGGGGDADPIREVQEEPHLIQFEDDQGCVGESDSIETKTDVLTQNRCSDTEQTVKDQLFVARGMIGHFGRGCDSVSQRIIRETDTR
jgi:hypothetical protein